MSETNRASEQYLRNAVLTATPEQLQLMLLDGAIRFISRGLDALHARDHEALYNAMDRAQRIVLELINGMRREINPQLVDRMTALYNFVYRRLVEATVGRDAQAAEEALRILRLERETWALLIDKLARERGAAAVPPPPDLAADVPADARAGRSALCLEG